MLPFFPSVKRLDLKLAPYEALRSMNLNYFTQLEVLDISDTNIMRTTLTSLSNYKNLKAMDCTGITTLYFLPQLFELFTFLQILNYRYPQLSVTVLEKWPNI